MTKCRFTSLAVVFLFAFPLFSQTARTPEQMKAGWNAHHGDFDYLLGDWEFTATNKQFGKFRGYWSAEKIADGQIYDEYRVVGDKNETFYVTRTVRAYNAALDQWELVSIEGAAGLQNWGTGHRNGGAVTIEQKFGYGTPYPSLWHIRYHDIGKDRFLWNGDRSPDGGKTWEKDYQVIEAHRVGPPRTKADLTPPKK